MPKGQKKCQLQGQSQKDLLTAPNGGGGSWGCSWACPSKVLVARANAASQGACPGGATWTYAFFLAGRHFTEISFFGRPACHLANVPAPKVGCALKYVAWASDPTRKQHPKANSGPWPMGLEMANSVAIAAGDKFIKFIKNVPKKCIRPMNAPKIICHNHMQPHACAGCHPKALLKFSTFDSESGSCGSELGGPHGPHGLEACLALHVGPQWPELANTCWGLLSACVGTVPCTWLHTARLFWCANTFWPPLGHFCVPLGILAVFCRLWAAANWAMVGARPCKVAQSLL